LTLFGFSGWTIWKIYQEFRDTVTKQFRLQQLAEKTMYYDEALTASANMAVSTGDLKWLERYDRFASELDGILAEIIQISPQAAADLAPTQSATDKLYALEDQAFELLRQGNRADATKILFGSEYAKQKKNYSQGVEQKLAHLTATVAAELQSYGQRLLWLLIFVGASLPLMLLCWGLIISGIRRYVQERNKAQTSLLDSQASLRQLNEKLEQRVEQRTQQLAVQEQAARKESEILQADVGKLLDVVSAVEEGNLSVEAPVSERVTGLVADTFNRVVEQLAQIMALVSSTAQQVTQSAENLEQLAVQTVQQVRQQTQSVETVQTLMENINALTQDNRQQTQTANESVQQTQEALDRGQQQMTQLTTGIDTLEQGTDQIVRRVETLTDFVQLAVQFAKDQKRIASITKVLSLNASLLSERATEQQDPEQFASIAREFETIAGQVNNLAVQTSQSLILLQERIDRIQTVVSGLNQDVGEINQIVKDFTTGVGQSRQVFGEIRTATVQVEQVGQQVTQSSQAIAKATQTTLKSIEEIASFASDTEQQANITREQSEVMGQLARDLYQMVRFFRIPPEQMQAASAVKVLQPTSANDNKSNGTLPNLTNSANHQFPSSTNS
jgi:twitching motility protein PilJ